MLSCNNLVAQSVMAVAGNVVLSVITDFTNEFRTVIDGNTNDHNLNELSGGVRISVVYHELGSQRTKGSAAPDTTNRMQ